MPHRIVGHFGTPFGQKGAQPMQGQMRGMLYLIQNEIAVRIENRFAVAANLTGLNAARLPVALMPFDDTRNRNAKTFRYNTCSLTRNNGIHSALP